MLASAIPAIALNRSGFAQSATVQSAIAQPAAAADEREWHHGLSLYGDLKYKPGFKHFDYVNVSAPKGGLVRQVAIGTFDNFNPVIAGMKGNVASGLGLIFDSLTTNSMDEVTSAYGLLAESVSYPDDYSSATYRLRREAKWHDGRPVTPEDVIFSFEAYKQHSPQLSAYYQHVLKAEKTGERDVTFTFDAPGNREMPQIVGEFSIVPKHWFEATDSSGKPRDVAATTLEVPLGNSAYRIKEFVPGHSIVYERVKDYWGKDLPVNIGRNNFDQLRYEYFRDSTIALEAFKADQIDFRVENVARFWATAYDFPAVTEKRVVKEEFPIRSSGVMQAFVLNTRRAKFSDPRVRHAFNLALDFEEMNKQFFFGQYTRIASYYEGTELASSGLPTGLELEILETVRGEVPPEVFTTVYKNPVNGNAEAVRNNLREATRLLHDAGWEIKNQKLVNSKTGEPMEAEFLLDEPIFERFVLFYKPLLERLGIAVTVRTVDDAQYENRTRAFDFDIIVNSWPQSLSPGNEQRGDWGSRAVDRPGSRNLIGIANPAVDKLINRLVFSKTRPELVAATRALDRVLLWNHYVVPQWTYRKVRTAYWDRYAHPQNMPEYGAAAFPIIWWWDEAKAAKTGGHQ
jgi:microcin C transport system substrate-binding protein